MKKETSKDTLVKRASPADEVEEQFQTVHFNWSLVRRLFDLTLPHRKLRDKLLLTVVLRAIQLPILTWMIGVIIDGPIRRGDFGQTLLYCAGLLLLVVFTEVVFYYRMKFALILGENAVNDLRREFFAKLQQMPMSYYHTTRLGRIISRVTSDIESLRVGIQQVFFVSMVQAGQMIFSAIFMIYYDFVLFCIVLAMAPVIYLLNQQFRSHVTRATRSAMESWSRVTATIAESVSGIRVTQGYSRQERNARLFKSQVDEHSSLNVEVARAQAVFQPLLEFNSQFFIVALILIGGWQVLHPSAATSIGDIIQFFFLANLFFAPIQVLGTQYAMLMQALAGAERIFKVLDSEPEWTDSPTAIDLPDISGHVIFRDVTFGYHKDRPVLHSISFEARPGQSVALVGHTGSGKSSIINLLGKFYLPDSGQILFGGRDIREITSSSLHRRMGIVQQQNFLFTGTILDNIRFSKPLATNLEVIEAARNLDCLDMIESLPEGFNTQVGEKGASLSLGQRQMVCFVRAFLADPRILILDEATSSLDVLTEKRIQNAIGKLLEGRTSFIVAHRLSTIRHANLVLVLDQGRIVEAGTHESLLALGGYYSSLHEQFVH
ncbi:ABC transporter ATP-binding protein [Kamptonema cortianum]|uniref:ABC transporter ATP-binding protein n=1 Tax=Geitlerinema calcuttense NRMC-F 0142 TaxID=2922238 RepID=A0ABT7LY28_9CYAN|nr:MULTISPECIES: ABC transporter ATP-binding protein [Cyanophyceae]MDK3157503.1 ABC transporter ATP-binding protein [Kamptonema cortianum]MDL5052615.1 ABC transporter ATP-binding protein [Oscillatoria laete-virens NRMC-F 0139]MDL5056919.1 ABC transporter ATP-binding protein [Geitlerinema calcuttense NRMC-F 0142]